MVPRKTSTPTLLTHSFLRRGVDRYGACARLDDLFDGSDVPLLPIRLGVCLVPAPSEIATHSKKLEAERGRGHGLSLFSGGPRTRTGRIRHCLKHVVDGRA